MFRQFLADEESASAGAKFAMHDSAIGHFEQIVRFGLKRRGIVRDSLVGAGHGEVGDKFAVQGIVQLGVVCTVGGFRTSTWSCPGSFDKLAGSEVRSRMPGAGLVRVTMPVAGDSATPGWLVAELEGSMAFRGTYSAKKIPFTFSRERDYK